MVVALSGFADNFYGDHLWSWHAFVTSLPLAFVYLVATVTLVRVQSVAYRCDLVSAPCFVTIELDGGYRGCLVCYCVGNGGVWVSHQTRATVSAGVWAVGDAVMCIGGLFVWFSIRCVTNNCAYFALKMVVETIVSLQIFQVITLSLSNLSYVGFGFMGINGDFATASSFCFLVCFFFDTQWIYNSGVWSCSGFKRFECNHSSHRIAVFHTSAGYYFRC